MQRFNLPSDFGSPYDREAPSWAVNGGLFGWPDVIWGREAEVKHGRVAMLASLGLIVQDVAPGLVPFPWFEGEKVWALHDKLVKVGGAYQVLLLILALEIPFIQKAAAGELDGTGNFGLSNVFDPLGLAKDEETFAVNQLKEVKNGRLAMIAFGGMMQHYLVTGKGPVQFISEIPNFKSCSAKASELPGAKVASLFIFGNTLEVADALCR